jgi:glyoxylase-like metal-dependent hydrolase (beta-lactamase superfamily II)
MGNLGWMIGEVRITRIVELEVPLPASGLLPEATPEALAPYSSWLQPHFADDEGNFILSIHGLLIESCGHRILVDTCVGDRSMPGFEMLSSAESRFLVDLEAAGFPRESIDIVLCTHLHFDHVGWNTMRDGDTWVPTFPNARYLFARIEWEHWRSQDSPVFASTLGEAVQPIFDAGLADLVETDHIVTDDVRLEATPGHTPGHVAVHISSKGQRAMITGDLTHHPVQWAETGWRMPADSDGEQAAATRRRLLEQYADSDLLVIGTHYAAPTAGHLVSDAGSWRFRAYWD